MSTAPRPAHPPRTLEAHGDPCPRAEERVPALRTAHPRPREGWGQWGQDDDLQRFGRGGKVTYQYPGQGGTRMDSNLGRKSIWDVSGPSSFRLPSVPRNMGVSWGQSSYSQGSSAAPRFQIHEKFCPETWRSLPGNAAPSPRLPPSKTRTKLVGRQQRGDGASAAFGKPDSVAAILVPECPSGQSLGRYPRLRSSAGTSLAAPFLPPYPCACGSPDTRHQGATESWTRLQVKKRGARAGVRPPPLRAQRGVSRSRTSSERSCFRG